jgi:hypothetical protein
VHVCDVMSALTPPGMIVEGCVWRPPNRQYISRV